ncbi:MAG: winged helix-turn-helix domain-containing protein [Acidiferrobacter sp.]
MCFLPLLVHTAICQFKLALSAIQKRMGKAPRPPAVLICAANPLATRCAEAITDAGWTGHRVPGLRYVDRAAYALSAVAVVTDRIAALAARHPHGAWHLPVAALGPARRAPAAFHGGAALFVPLPLHPPTLILGLSRIIRATGREEAFGGADANGLWLDPLTAQARVGATPLALSPRHFCVLHELARVPGKLLSAEQLCSGHTGIHSMTPAALAVCVSRLRKVLRDAGAPDCIETVYRLGYRYTVPAPQPEALRVVLS